MENHNPDKKVEGDRFSRLMFGPRMDKEQTRRHRKSPSNQSAIDFEQLMADIDTLMDSARNLKPLFQKVFPFVERVWKKK